MIAPALAAISALLLSIDPRSQLSALERRREAESAAARLLADQERSVLDEVQRAEEAVVRAQQELLRVEMERDAAERAQASAATAEGEAAARLRGRLDELRPRLAARARLGRSGELAVLFSAPSLAELVKRRALFDRILRRDAGLVTGARMAWEEREQARAASQAEAARLAALAGSLQELGEQSRARREERETLLEALRTARGFHERAAAEAATQARALAAFVATLPSRAEVRSAGGAFAASRGTLRLPASGTITRASPRRAGEEKRCSLIQSLTCSPASATPIRRCMMRFACLLPSRRWPWPPSSRRRVTSPVSPWLRPRPAPVRCSPSR